MIPFTNLLKKWGATMAEYIDITSIKEQIAHVKRNVKSENSAYLIGYISALSTVEGMIASLPKADVKPVQYGEWAGTVCCCCGESTVNYYDCDYCPNCGAKMDGKEVQNERV